MATTNDLKNGMVLNLDGQLWAVTEFQHVKPGKGGAFVRTTLKNVLSGKVVDKTFNAGTKVETATVDSTFFRVVRTKAPPLPGFTCWKSVKVQSWPSRLRTMPFFRSLVVAI